MRELVLRTWEPTASLERLMRFEFFAAVKFNVGFELIELLRNYSLFLIKSSIELHTQSLL